MPREQRQPLTERAGRPGEKSEDGHGKNHDFFCGEHRKKEHPTKDWISLKGGPRPNQQLDLIILLRD